MRGCSSLAARKKEFECWLHSKQARGEARRFEVEAKVDDAQEGLECHLDVETRLEPDLRLITK